MIDAEEARKLVREQLQKEKEERLAEVETKCAAALEQIEHWIVLACKEGRCKFTAKAETFPYSYMMSNIAEYLHDKLGYDTIIEWNLGEPTKLTVSWAED